MNGVTSMANNFYNSWMAEQNYTNKFSASTKINSNLNISDLANIANQYNNINENRANIKSYYDELSKNEDFSFKDFLSSGSSSSQASENFVEESKAFADKVKALSSAEDTSPFKQATDGSYNMNKISTAVNNFVTSYNDIISSVSNSGSMSVLQKGFSLLNESASDYSDLSKVGIKIETNGKLTLNTTKLENADISDIKSVFEGENSYAGKISNIADNLSQTVQSNQYQTYNSFGIASFNFSSTLGNFINFTA